ncbi:MAG: hypothetical protein Q4Q62_06540 [Thermoplasmata archaeon]|nr:hypothetical protein [Thermoplasmata archaeon]
MKTKTNQRAKLLSVVAIFAMVAAAFVVLAPVANDVDAADTTYEAELSGDIVSISGGESQTVTISADSNVVYVAGTSATIVIKNLVVPEGVTLTLDGGTSLQVTGTATIEGTVVVDYDASITNSEAATFDVQGTAKITGDVQVYGNFYASVVSESKGAVTVASGGEITIEETGVLGYLSTGSTGSVTIEASGTLNNYGTISLATISNSGTVKIDSEKTAAALTIYQVSSTATVNIVNLISTAGVIVSDSGLKYSNTTPTGTDTVTIKTGDATTAIRGLVISESVTADTENKNTYLKSVVISGTASVSTSGDDEATATIDIAGSVAVSDTLTLAKGITLSNASGSTTLAVSGILTVVTAFKNTADMTVTIADTGLISVAGTPIAVETNVSAAKYTSTDSTTTTYYYVSVLTMLTAVNESGNTITTFDVIGTPTLKTSATLPADVTMSVLGTLTIGEKNGSDVTLTVASGATLKGSSGTIDVNGTLYAENKTNVKSTVTINSDVYSVQTENNKAVKDGWAKYTNVYSALSGASADETITVTKAAGSTVNIEKNLTIPAGVTLYVPTGVATLKVSDGVTITVIGTLASDADITAATQFTTVATKTTSAIVLSGDDAQIMLATGIGSGITATTLYKAGGTTASNIISAGAPIAGAYYNTDKYVIISALAAAVADEDIASQIYIYGAVTAGDITFAAETGDVCTTINVMSDVIAAADNASTSDVNTSLTVTSLVLSGTSVVVNYTSTTAKSGTITGAISVGDATLTLKGVAATGTADATFSVAANTDGYLVIDGNANTTDESVFTVSAGTVYAGSTGFNYSQTKTKVDVALTVASGATLVGDNIDSASKVIVNGTLLVDAGDTSEIATLVDLGTVTVNAESETSSIAGSLTVDVLYIGLDVGATTGSSAAFTGDVSLGTTGYAVVLNGSTLSDATVEALGERTTTYVVGTTTWITVYAASSTLKITTITVAPVTDAVFEDDWVNSQDASAAGTTTAYVGADGWETVYAVVDYDIYAINIVYAAGFSSIYLDDVLVSAYATKTVNGVTCIILTAGEHKITVDTAYGYTGTLTLTVNGTVQSGNTFTLSGTPDDGDDYVTYTVQLTGMSPQDSSSSSNDSSMGLTDYLLIILVVLIAVMAIVIAARLLRS